MAAASLDHTRLIAYALEHGTSAAARKFRVSDSYVRRLKRQAGESSAPARAGLRVVAAPSVAVSRVTQLHLLPANMVARAGTLWRCPACHELVRPAAGALWNEWIKQKKCLHGVLGDNTRSAEQLPKTVYAIADEVPVLDRKNEASGSDKSVVPVPQQSSAAEIPPAFLSSQIAGAGDAGPQVHAVRSFVLAWLAEYWRLPLAVALGLLVVGLCYMGVR